MFDPIKALRRDASLTLFTCDHGVEESWFHALRLYSAENCLHSSSNQSSTDSGTHACLLHAVEYAGEYGDMTAVLLVDVTVAAGPKGEEDHYKYTILDALVDYSLDVPGDDTAIRVSDEDLQYFVNVMDENGWRIFTPCLRRLFGGRALHVSASFLETADKLTSAHKANMKRLMQHCHVAIGDRSKVPWGVSYPWRSVEAVHVPHDIMYQ
jgi:hypothetical protein